LWTFGVIRVKVCIADFAQIRCAIYQRPLVALYDIPYQ